MRNPNLTRQINRALVDSNEGLSSEDMRRAYNQFFDMFTKLLAIDSEYKYYADDHLETVETLRESIEQHANELASLRDECKDIRKDLVYLHDSLKDHKEQLETTARVAENAMETAEGFEIDEDHIRDIADGVAMEHTDDLREEVEDLEQLVKGETILSTNLDERISDKVTALLDSAELTKQLNERIVAEVTELLDSDEATAAIGEFWQDRMRWIAQTETKAILQSVHAQVAEEMRTAIVSAAKQRAEDQT